MGQLYILLDKMGLDKMVINQVYVFKVNHEYWIQNKLKNDKLTNGFIIGFASFLRIRTSKDYDCTDQRQL